MYITMLFNQRCYGNSKFKKIDLMDIRDMESPIFTLSPSSTVENPSRFVKERLKLGIASYFRKIAIPRLSLSFTHRDGFSTVEDGESVKNSYFLEFIQRCDRRTRFWKKNFCLNFFSGATEGQGFGRRIFFFF